MFKVDLVGQRFTKLNVISEAQTIITIGGSKKRKFICKCDCGKTLRVDYSELRSGKTKSCGCIRAERLSGINLGSKNANWLGDDIGKISVHGWIRRHKPKPDLCECCENVPPYDLANISQEYKRDVNDFEWLCRKCHMIKDERYKNLKNQEAW